MGPARQASRVADYPLRAINHSSGGLVRRALITGITGQDGRYLAEFLTIRRQRVFGLGRGKNGP